MESEPVIGRRGAHAKGVARRQEILDRAIEVFRERGADGTSLRRIAEAIGVSHSRAHDFQTVLDAAEQLKASPEIVFLMIGEGQQRRYVEEEARRRGLSNIVMKPFQPVDQLSESLGAADVHLVSLKPELEHCIVPSKFYGVLAAARPTIFIGDPDGEIATVIRDFHCGVSLCPGEVEMLVSAILLLRNSQFNRKLMGNNARYLMETAYSREFGAAVWQSAVGRLLRKEPLPAMPILDRQLQAEKLQ